jgi:hypothetical protein
LSSLWINIVIYNFFHRVLITLVWSYSCKQKMNNISLSSTLYFYYACDANISLYYGIEILVLFSLGAWYFWFLDMGLSENFEKLFIACTLRIPSLIKSHVFVLLCVRAGTAQLEVGLDRRGSIPGRGSGISLSHRDQPMFETQPFSFPLNRWS